MIHRELIHSSLYNDASLIAYWRMEGNSNDSKGSNNGTDTAITYGTGYGKFGQGASFNGTSSKIVTSNNIGISGDAVFTISAWLYINWDTLGAIIYKSGGNFASNNGLLFAIGSQVYGDIGLVFQGGSASYQVCTAGPILSSRTWYHVAVTKTAGNPKTTTLFYLNGINQPTRQDVGQTTSPNITNSSVTLGCWQEAPDYYTPQYLDDVAVFSRALSSSEVYNLYNGDKTKLSWGENVGAGRLPCADDSSIGLNTWPQFKVLLDRSVEAGKLSTQDVVSTYPLVYTTTSAYGGGVLSSNGDIHFIPLSAAVGQKISAAGVVSTYSLVYTTVAAYMGGVLNSSGDIHFIPIYASVGQKISASGVVSTYSLVYTLANGYWGGVLASNGDIYFVPHSATRGQKISSSGVVSTYSLVYTVASAYRGGILAPNGDIHFIPYDASVGQKISSSGLVSTYSLVYTGFAYLGGILNPNGDVNFVPYNASVGQKISVNGIVSTYSLINSTPDTNAYRGGTLAPNGDIHFAPYESSIGQKVSSAGVVSTYSLVYTVSSAYNGSVLDASGNIYFIPYSSAVGQKISTQSALPFSLGTCCSPYFNKF